MAKTAQRARSTGTRTKKAQSKGARSKSVFKGVFAAAGNQLRATKIWFARQDERATDLKGLNSVQKAWLEATNFEPLRVRLAFCLDPMAHFPVWSQVWARTPIFQRFRRAPCRGACPRGFISWPTCPAQ